MAMKLYSILLVIKNDEVGCGQNSGKLAPLDEILRFKEKYKFRILVDESNSIGVLGATGRGLTEHFNIPV